MRDPEQSYSPPVLEQLLRIAPSPNLAVGLADLITEYSRILSWAAYNVKARLRTSRWLAETYAREPGAPRCERGNIHTFFTPVYRRQSLDLDSRAIRDGLRISKTCLQRIADTCRSHKVQPLLLLIHNKEHCYHGLLGQVGDPSARALEELASLEQRATQEITAAAQSYGMPILDPTKPMRDALAADRRLWPANSDGHLNPSGCALLAELLHARLRELGVSGQR